MYPTQHAALTALALVPLRKRGWSLPELGLFAASAVLIDVDHYLSYAIKTGDWSLPRAYRWHARRVPPIAHKRPHFYRPALVLDRYRPFHALLPIALLFVLGWLGRSPTPALHRRRLALVPVLRCVRPLAWGAVFHRLCDYSLEVFEHRPGVPTDAARNPACQLSPASRAPAPPDARGLPKRRFAE